jgi:putative heme iron utilization protein
LLLFEILSDIVKIEDILLIVKNTSATSEIKSNSLNIKQRENWITIGNNDDPAHIHINSEMIKNIEFIQEKRPERISFSVRFFDREGERVLAAFFTKMYDEQKNLNLDRKKVYDDLRQKYGSIIQM